MKNISIYYNVILLVFINILSLLSQNICFYRNNNVWLSDINGQNQKLLFYGNNPEISPDGRNIVFTDQIESSDGTWNTQIGIYLLSADSKTMLSTIPGVYNTYPHWSPHCKFIAFTHWSGKQEEIAYIDSLGNNYKVLTENISIKTKLEFAYWKNDSDIVLHDKDFFYEINLNRNLVSQNPIRDIVVDYNGNAISFSFMIPNKQLLFTNIYSATKEYGEPNDAIFLYDLKSNLTSRLTSDTLHAQYPSWHPNGYDIIFQGIKQSTDKTNIYKISIVGNDLKMLIEDGQNPSCSIKSF
jgi:Tol biopolymer transport system component